MSPQIFPCLPTCGNIVAETKLVFRESKTLRFPIINTNFFVFVFPKCFSLFPNLPTMGNLAKHRYGTMLPQQCFRTSLPRVYYSLIVTHTWTHIYRGPQVRAFLAEPVALEALMSLCQGQAHVLEVCHIMSKLLEIMVLGLTSHTPLTYKWTIPNK